MVNDECVSDEDINEIKAMMMNLYQAIRVLSYSNSRSSYRDVAMREPAGSPQLASMFRPSLRDS